MRAPVVWILLFAATAGAPVRLAAQNAPKAMCFRGRPADRCRWFSITETRYYFSLSGGPGTSYLMVEGGLMRNVSRTTAVGITAWGGTYLGGSETIRRYGFALRGRRWVGPLTSVEGLIGAGHTSGGDQINCSYTVHGDYRCERQKQTAGMIGALQFNVADRYHFAVRVERMPEGRSCPRQYASLDGCIELVPQPGYTWIGVDHSVPAQTWRVYVGTGIGSKGGVGSWIVAAALTGLFAATWHD